MQPVVKIILGNLKSVCNVMSEDAASFLERRTKIIVSFLTVRVNICHLYYRGPRGSRIERDMTEKHCFMHGLVIYSRGFFKGIEFI